MAYNVLRENQMDTLYIIYQHRNFLENLKRGILLNYVPLNTTALYEWRNGKNMSWYLVYDY